MSTAVESAIRDAIAEAERRGWLDTGRPNEVELARYADEMLKWNRRINLTAITDPREVAVLHFLDSLALLPHLPMGAKVLDVGTGAGFPGLPVALSRPDLHVTLVDRTEKKVSFLKVLIARLGVENARALHLRIDGDPEGEGLGVFDAVVSRAFTAPASWFPLAASYVTEDGLVVGMVGSEDVDLQELGSTLGVGPGELSSLRYELPGGFRRGLVLWRRGESQRK